LDEKLEKSLQKIGAKLDLEESARYSGAMLRHRLVKTAMDLLRMILVYSLCDCSLRMVGVWGTLMEVGSLSKTAILKRFRKCRRWLGMMIVVLLKFQNIHLPKHKGIRLRLIDATSVSQPGSHQTDWKVHLSFDLSHACIEEVQLADGKSVETLTRFNFQTGDICLADRIYGRLVSLGVLLGGLTWFVIRISWKNLPVQSTEGQPFSISNWLRVQSTDPAAYPAQAKVWIDTPHGRFPIRLIARTIPFEKAERTRKRLLAEAKKKKRKVDERTLLAAGFVVVVSNLPDVDWSPPQILELYRLRWQIELFFKRLKGIFQLDCLRAKDPELVQVFLLAKILAALLVCQIQLYIMEADPEIFQQDHHPISLWRLTQAIFDLLRDTLRGYFTLSLFLKHWPQLERYLCDDPRHRIQQFTHARINLGIL